MVPSRVSVGLTHSSSSSGVYYQGDAQSQTGATSHLSPFFGYSSNSLPATAGSNQGATSGDMNGAALNSMGNSGPSLGANSLVTDANSALSGGPHLQRSASINTESYMRLPASPMSFTSNNISISGSSVIDGSSVVQQGSHQDQTAQQLQQCQQEQGNSSVTSLPPSQAGQLLLPLGSRVPSSFIQNPNNLAHVQKKPRIDLKQEDFIQQQVLQQLLQRRDPMLQNQNPQLQALLQHQRLRQQQQQILQSMPHLQRAQLQQQQQQQQLQLRQQLQQQGMQPMNMKRPYDSGVCARRLMQYLYHQRQRPPDNAIAYWRKFVTEYYSPHAKKRWCLSLYENVGQHALGVFPQAAMDAWHCDICGSKSGRGFEATFEVLPRLNEIKFGSGVIDELLFVDLPKEYRLPTGIMVLEYQKAVQESVYEQLRVVREGQLRIRFAHDLKILSWEFCARRHEELLPRRLVAPQVHQLVQVVQKCQSTITESGAEVVSSQDLQNNSNMVLSAGRQLAKTLELQSLNDLGFSKRYVRCLQISEVVNSMKDLIDFCKETNTGPIEGLKNFPRHAFAAQLQMQKLQEMEQLANVQGLATDRNTLSKLMALRHSGLNNQLGHPNLAHRGALRGSPQAGIALTTGYQNLLMRQNSMNSNSSSLQQEASLLSNSVQGPTGTFPAPKLLHSSGYSSPNLPPQQQALNSPTGMLLQNPSQSQGSQTLHQQMIQHLLQEMSNNNGGGGGMQQAQFRNGMGFRNNHPALSQGQAQAQAQAQVQAQSKMQAQLQVQPASSNVSGQAPSRSNSFKGTGSISDSCAAPAAGNNGGCNPEKAAPDMAQDLHLSDDIVSDIGREFTDNGFFGGDLDDTMGFEWKALED